MQVQIIIQCAGTKTVKPDDNKGYFRDSSGRRVKFVAKPERAGSEPNTIFCRPDDPSDEPGFSWRQLLKRYIETGENPFGLKRACELYENKVYMDLVSRFGPENVFILSAGWGLVGSNFLVPAYDITFSAPRKDKTGKVHREVQRDQKDKYDDFQQIPRYGSSPIVCFVTQKYRPQLERMALRRDLRWPPPKSYTNWHYCAAQDFINRKLEI